jgi:CRISPR-associated endonuclease Csn1
MATASYVYDKEARSAIKEVIDRTGIPIAGKERLLNEVKKYLKKNPLTDITGKKFKTIKIAKFTEYAAKRVALDKTFNHKKINKIPFAKVGKSTLGNLLHQHLDSPEYRENGRPSPALAFSQEGLEALSKKAGRPVNKVTIVEKPKVPESKKFQGRFIEADKGSNTYFIIYENISTKKRLIDKNASIPTHKAIEYLVKNRPLAEDRNGYKKIFLSPGDLTYVPTEDETKKIQEGSSIIEAIDWKNKNTIAGRIYQVRKFSGNECYFIKSNIAALVLPYSDNEDDENEEDAVESEMQDTQRKKVGEFGSQNLSEYSIDDLPIKIKEVCIKLSVDRLGNIKPL